ncbi:MAG: translation elongation factor-like protein [bacterium]|nr:translation elongation factor-like protein [bacterium]
MPKTTTKTEKKPKEPKPIGEVTHFYGNLDVAIVKFKKSVDVGTKVKFKGATSDFEETIKSMQFDHKPVRSAEKGQEVGIKVGEKVREGDEVYEVE